MKTRAGCRYLAHHDTNTGVNQAHGGSPRGEPPSLVSAIADLTTRMPPIPPAVYGAAILTGRNDNSNRQKLYFNV